MMSRRTALLFAALLTTAGCPTTSTVKPDPSPAKKTGGAGLSPGGYVVVTTGMKLHSAPSDAAPAWVVPHDDAKQTAPYTFHLRHVATKDGWAEVVHETSPDAKTLDHCTTRPPLAGAAVRFFVKASTLPKVTQRVVTMDFKDGTTITLGTGLPFRPVAEAAGTTKLFALEHPELAASLPLDPSALGTVYAPKRYTPPALPEGFLSKTALWLPAGMPAQLNAGMLSARYLRPFHLPERADGSQVTLGPRVTGVQPAADGKTTLVQFQASCVRVVGRVPASAPTTIKGGLGGLGLRGAGGTNFRVATGAALTWPDGKPAGTTTTTLSVYEARMKEKRADGRRCFELPLHAREIYSKGTLGGAAPEHPTVCAPEASITSQ